MAENALAAEARNETGKGVARKLRSAGRIPAVLYGKGTESRSLSVDHELLDTLLHASGAGLNTLIDLEVDGGSQKVLLKALQREPVGGDYLHADFYQVDLSRRVTVSVPLHFVGIPRGVAMDEGILDHPVREVELECLPTSIPESIEVDVSSLALNESLHVSDLVLPADSEMKSDAALTVAAVAPPKAVEEEEVAEVEGEEGLEGEPEVEGGEAAAEGDASDNKEGGGE